MPQAPILETTSAGSNGYKSKDNDGDDLDTS
jgi:hypothetical protein